MSKITRIDDSNIAGLGNLSHVSEALYGALADREAIPLLLNECGYLDWLANAKHQYRRNLEEAIASGEAVQAEHPWLFGQLETLCVRATIDDIRRELAILYMAFPAKDANLANFMHIVFSDVVNARPSHFVLAAACRQLRHTVEVRPPIAKILRAMKPTTDDPELRWLYHAAANLAAVPALVATARRRLVLGDYIENRRL
ncbi:hypothetical protein QA639_25475 [Bradyrhizobium pachyrhizi]|uniref:hypothetical protein n=1 Tax=Bradyrhizobium pachyrhizi TaxID=280333 RepID=UPI0024B05387|nr:hypothetical protein [Bradyrhizobium pachyrhizi]WFU53026.1 hypothetical protein QA639_25475 [Bradyrhizobium pachyrhizi]